MSFVLHLGLGIWGFSPLYAPFPLLLLSTNIANYTSIQHEQILVMDLVTKRVLVIILGHRMIRHIVSSLLVMVVYPSLAMKVLNCCLSCYTFRHHCKWSMHRRVLLHFERRKYLRCCLYWFVSVRGQYCKHWTWEL